MKLLLLQGLPSSGKTIYANTLSAQDWEVVTKDDIRTELEATGWTWSKDKEREVIAIRNARIEEALGRGVNVVSADTNFARVHKVVLRQIAQKCGAEFEIKRFDVTVEECLRRNELRSGKAKVPTAVIMKMYEDYVANDPEHFPRSARIQLVYEPVVYQAGLPQALVCDLDGTLALYEHMNHRGHYDASNCYLDDVNMPVREVLLRFAGDTNIIYLTGREEIYREATAKFLEDRHCPSGQLLMRPKGDTRKDTITKMELFDQNVRGRFNVLFCLEDRPRVVRMWRKLGLTTLTVGGLEDF